MCANGHSRAFLSTGMHSRRQECIPDDRNVFLSIFVFHARSPARKQHLGLPGGAAGAMHAHTLARPPSCKLSAA